jgi:uncharacterized protein YndB with AHSA1/START domain
MNSLIVKNSITIKAPASLVWDVLTNPEKTKLYMFGCETVSDWNVDSELLWKANYEGKEMVFVKGRIIELEPNVKLVYSTFDPNSELEDIPENYVNVTYELIENDGVCTLNVSQGDFATVADGERRYKETSNNGDGWNPVLTAIKNLIESSSSS